MDNCVILVQNRVRVDHNLHLSWKIPKEDKTDAWLSMISFFDSVVAVYEGLPSELSKPNSNLKQSM